MPQTASIAQRFTFIGGYLVSPAYPSQHSRRTYGAVSHAIVGRGIKIYQLFVLCRNSSTQIPGDAFLQLVFDKFDPSSSTVYLLEV